MFTFCLKKAIFLVCSILTAPRLEDVHRCCELVSETLVGVTYGKLLAI